MVPGILEPLGTTPSGQPARWYPGWGSPPVGGSPSGTTREQVVPDAPEPPADEPEQLELFDPFDDGLSLGEWMLGLPRGQA